MRAKSLRISANISTRTRDEKVAELLHLASHIEPIGVVTGIEVTLSGGDPKRNSKYVTWVEFQTRTCCSSSVSVIS